MSTPAPEPDRPPFADGMAEDTGPEPGPADALRQRVQAETARWTTVLKIVLTESRLAGGSALILLALALISAALGLVSWLLLMALLILGLAALGLGAAAAVSVVLAVHVLGLLAAALLAKRCLADLRFKHSLAALGLSRGPGPSAGPPT